ncbi:Ig-like domain-containing protein [Rhodococcus marinonascens]|uniref:Ig-like domain-containing protein n=1 Tax=Rhodococcus marinonascens TaxID=38311 RepID=UPI00093518B8|nr:Ig-like domain-containing protein [Rhodococcus marinonascens]
MLNRNIRRVVGNLSAVAVAAGLAVTVGAGTAGAASDTVTWTNSNTKFTRTISDVNPREGDIITSKTKLERSAALEYIYEVKDYHPACLEFVSAKVDGKNQNLDSRGDDWAKVKGSWVVRPLLSPKSRTFEFSYRVGANCDRDEVLTTGVSYEGSLIHRDQVFKTKGPNVTVLRNQTTATLDAPSSTQVGQSVLLHATVAGGAQGDNVEFYDGNAKIATVPLNSDRVATYNWTPTTSGNHSMSAKFLATSKAEGSHSPVRNVSVSQTDAESSTILAPITGAQVGRSSTLKATVSPPGAGGTVEFRDGGATLANVPVDGGGVATYTWVPSTAGDHNIAASFSGRPGVAGSTTSTTVNVTEAPVGNIESTTVLTIGANPTVGVAQNITAQVTPGNAGGTITFKDGDFVIGTSSVDPSGRATTTWTPSNDGQRGITAEYSGAGNVNASVDQQSVVVGAVPSGGGSSSAGNTFGS